MFASIYSSAVNFTNSLSLAQARNRFIRPRFNYFVQHDDNLFLTINSASVDQSFLVYESFINYDLNICDGWFGIPFTDSLCATHIRSHNHQTF